MQFLCPEKGQNPKRAQIGSVWNFPVLQVEIPRNHGHKPNLKGKQSKFLNLGPTEQSVPKLPHLPNPYFGTEIGNSDDASPEISYIWKSLPNFKCHGQTVPKLQGSVLLVPKMGQCQKTTMPHPYPEFYWGLLQLWGIQPSPENFGKIHQADLLWEFLEILGPKFQRAGLKKKSNGFIAIWYRRNLRKNFFVAGLRPVWPNTRSDGFVFFPLLYILEIISI